ncbi:hypothetical protein ANCCAN_05479 [Ancylostoma caninum]|uniref:Uncharacterized protein n=1 Tax=Ancylostoma caninum TaxID=29170 RepID=A0A368GVT1_ANCCA|nr:hypothetical protein ANCCAN_05479 [Ancylostoma caninum]
MGDPAVDEHLEEELEREEDDDHEEGVQAEPLPEEASQGNKSPEMDDDDVAEMSMIAAQIESAEDFNLTFEEDKANTSVAEALLNDWGSPRVDPKRSASRQRRSSEKRKSAENKATLLTTPKSRQPLKELTHPPSNARKRLSSSSLEGDTLSPGRKRRSSTPKSGEKGAVTRKRTSSISKGQVQSPKQILKARNV